MKRRLARAFSASLATAAVALLLAPSALAARPRVLAIEFGNDVNPVTADYVKRQIDRANDDRYSAAVLLLDTPGGLSSSMEEIYKKELASRIPVIVYISPEGGGAASAGVFIAQAADLLAMAPQTAIGASTPIGQGGSNLPSDARRKAINFFSKQLRSLAERHGRNGDWAEQAVRKASSLTAREALQRHVIDAVAPTLPALLDNVDGRKTTPRGIVLHTRGAEIDHVGMSAWERILDTLIDPNIIVLLMSIGTLGIVVELWNPGLIFPGTVGAISLILGLFGLSVLPISWAGVLLMLLAAGFLIADLFVTSHGALTLAGAVSFVFGALMLFNPAGDAYQVSLSVAVAIAGTMALFTAFVVTKLVQVRRKPVEVGVHGLVGATGEVRRDGLVFANGELWHAHSADDEPLRIGEHVVIEHVDGLELEVRPLREVEPAAPEAVS